MISHCTILYRGSLLSCNYGCEYCPFAKRHETHAELEGDRRDLTRFVDWTAAQQDVSFSVLFTPWGEALIRKWYQDALVRLTQLPHIRKAAIQTNLSCSLDWIARCDLTKLGLWCTYHPGETTQQRFLNQCRKLDEIGARYSVGIVGMKEHLQEIQAMRRLLRPDIYLWVNAYKREAEYYSDNHLQMLTAVDPLFPVNNSQHPSFGKPCNTGESVISVDGAGNIRRCHFIKDVIGNIYADNWSLCLNPRPCTNQTCGCHIGYLHMPHLGMQEVFGDGILERIPRGYPKSLALNVMH